MSRSYRKVLRYGVCCGSNTSYYRKKRKKFRAKLKHILTKSMKEECPDDMFVHPETVNQFKDTWAEPTDGYFIYTKEDATDRAIEINISENGGYVFYSLDELMSVKRKLKHTHKQDWNYGKPSIKR